MENVRTIANHRRAHSDAERRKRFDAAIKTLTLSAVTLRLTNLEAQAEINCERDIRIVDWLVANPFARDLMGRMAKTLRIEGLQVLAAYGAKRSHRQRASDHLWCDITAGFAQLLDRLRPGDDAIHLGIPHVESPANHWVSTQVGTAIFGIVRESRSTSHGYAPGTRIESPLRCDLDEQSGLDSDLTNAVTQAVMTAWLGLLSHEVELTNTQLSEVLRRLAVLLCPDASTHASVYDHCLAPLLGEATEDALVRLFPQFTQPLDWDSATAAPPGPIPGQTTGEVPRAVPAAHSPAPPQFTNPDAAFAS